MHLIQLVRDEKVCGPLRFVYLFFVCALFFPAASALADGNTDYLAALVLASREQHLSDDRYWNILLHYKPHGSRRVSLIADPNFFLAANGRTDPQAELEATLRSFFGQEHEGVDPPRCRFVARYSWLKERLQIDESRLPPVQCTKFDEALALINPKSAVLIFPAAHGNGPASMFGHTLIRIDGNARNDLLSYAVNYAAVTTDKNGFVYAFKGIFGFYHGYFSILPYYEKVGEYNEIEHRDIWEYELNLSDEEVRRMVLHIWELKDIYSDYYFFDENCSFDLLFLLEAARPSVNLTGAYWGTAKFWVIPSDTVRLVSDQGLVRAIKYRPSQARRIESLASVTDSADRQAALDVVDQKRPPQSVADMNIEPVEKMRILDLSAELLQYRFARKQLGKEDFVQRFVPTLQARSALGTSPAEFPPMPAPVSPDEGHLPGKFGIGAGYRDDDTYVQLGWRPAYHDLLDPDDGYIEGAQINFLDVQGRYYFKEDSLRLQRLRFLDIVSLAPRDAFFKPVSWKVNTGIDREIMSDGDEQLVFRLNPGGGFAYKSSLLGIAYLLGETDLNVSYKLRDRYALGFGASAGLLKNVTENWKANLAMLWTSYIFGDEHSTVKVCLGQNVKITANNSIAITLSREKTFGYYRSEVDVMWNIYK